MHWLPQAKPDILTGDETDTIFFVWETGFDALIDSVPISAQQKLYFLYQHLDGNAKTTTEIKSTTTACTQVCGEEETSRLCSRIVLVRAYHQSNPATKITTYAVLDDQFPDAFISDALLVQLELDAPKVDLQANTIVGSNSIRNKRVTGLSFQDLENEYAPINSRLRIQESTSPLHMRILLHPV